MRNFRWFALILFLFILAAARADAKPRIAIRAFDNKAGSGTSVPADAITDMMTTELQNAGIFSLMEREKLDYIAEEIKLGQSGLVDESTAPELGKIKGAQYTMTGAITLYFYNASGGVVYVPGILGAGAASNTAYVTIDLRIVSNTTGEVVYAAAEQGEAKREVAGLVTRFGGFANASYGGILAAATRDSVIKHVETMKQKNWED
ncbi:MAG: CsgG/HfaB family protein [Synergistaceae bacterium]|jgi:curli biogenesis system outer membrane secretion channel CsgG|nr:CsgG/HfaB family protein [Synergistaceae bacterium]